MSKVTAVTALHYGREWLQYAIESVISDIDEYIVLYSAEGSHSVKTPIRCPETRDELLHIARAAAGNKLRWFDGSWAYEGQQRDSIYEITDAPIIVTLDADEVWSPNLLRGLMDNLPTVRNIRLPFWHYWRSMQRVIKHDPAYPVRVVNRDYAAGESTYRAREQDVIHHFGYAQSAAIIEYKLKVHGHIAEIQRDWFHHTFLPNKQTNCHPVGSDYWNPEPCEAPTFLQHHPYAHAEVI